MESLAVGDRVLVADFFADLGFFRKAYTNMGPRSYPVPPFTVVRGMLAAVLGLDREKAPEKMAPARLAVRMLNTLRFTDIGVNYIKTTSPSHFARFRDHKPTRVEHVVRPCYRLYIHHPDASLHAALKEMLIHHRTHYTLSFGNSESLADFSWLEEAAVEAVDSGEVEVMGLLPCDQVSKIRFENRQCLTVTLPVTMTNQREVTSYREYIFDRTAAPLFGDVTDYVRLTNGDQLVFS